MTVAEAPFKDFGGSGACIVKYLPQFELVLCVQVCRFN